MKINEYLTESFNQCVKNPLIAVPMAASIVLVSLLSLLFAGSAIPFSGSLDPQQLAAGAGATLGGAMVLSILSTLVTFFAHGMTVALGNDVISGRPVSLRKGLDAVVERAVPLVISVILVGLLIGIGMVLLVLPGLVAAFFLMFTVTAVMVDHEDALRALRSSIRLVAANASAAFVLFLVIVALSVLFLIVNTILGMIPAVGFLVAILVSAFFSTFLTLVLLHAYRELRRAPAAPDVEA